MDSDYQNVDGSSTSRVRRCCGRFGAEFTQGPFEVIETSGNVIDVQRTFAPKPFVLVFFIKLLLTGLCVDTLVRDLITYDAVRSFYLAYLTHWGLVLAVAYNLLSLACTLLPYPEQPVSGAPISILIRMAWAGFSLTATVQIVIVLLFWQLEYVAGDEVSYFGYMKHGGVMILVLFQGFIVNRVPVRIHHLRYPIGLFLLYAVWSAIHDLYTNIGNPNSNGQEGDDDAIYSVMNWKKRPGPTATVFLVATFVVTPVLFLGVYLLSLPLRRYVVDPKSMVVTVKRKKETKPRAQELFAEEL